VGRARKPARMARCIVHQSLWISAFGQFRTLGAAAKIVDKSDLPYEKG
jgi:hypothetical protein